MNLSIQAKPQVYETSKPQVKQTTNQKNVTSALNSEEYSFDKQLLEQADNNPQGFSIQRLFMVMSKHHSKNPLVSDDIKLDSEGYPMWSKENLVSLKQSLGEAGFTKNIQDMLQTTIDNFDYLKGINVNDPSSDKLGYQDLRSLEQEGVTAQISGNIPGMKEFIPWLKENYPEKKLIQTDARKA